VMPAARSRAFAASCLRFFSLRDAPPMSTP
jgi:hypothetical protein